jgi:hypothetical protein
MAKIRHYCAFKLIIELKAFNKSKDNKMRSYSERSKLDLFKNKIYRLKFFCIIAKK